ncbi:MAG: hypothetical protein H7337_15245 [Rhizobacter sp.]|nr:hypothetical protein [Rhizobacter sp.]
MHNSHLVVGNAIDARTALQRRLTRARAAFGPEPMASMRAGGAGLAARCSAHLGGSA